MILPSGLQRGTLVFIPSEITSPWGFSFGVVKKRCDQVPEQWLVRELGGGMSSYRPFELMPIAHGNPKLSVEERIKRHSLRVAYLLIKYIKEITRKEV